MAGPSKRACTASSESRALAAYPASRRGSSRYCKDQTELEDYLTGEGIDGAMLTLGSGAQIAGEDLRRLHDLLLVDEDPVGLAQNVFEQFFTRISCCSCPRYATRVTL